MPALLSQADKETIKHCIPTASNKIITAAIAKLYISLPNSSRWHDTGLVGAAVLAYDQVGKCFFFKLVDVIGNQGILWDQELYEGFQYNQDRTFFHSFEIPDCMAGFSFADEREASNFYSKVEGRQKKVPSGKSGLGKMGSKMMGLFGKSDKHASDAPTLAPSLAPQATLTPETPRKSTFDPNDPEMAGVMAQLAELGITEDQIAGNEEFIKSFITQQAAAQPTTTTPARQQAPTRVPVPSSNGTASPRAPAPPPPPGPAPASSASSGPSIRRLPPPASATSNRPPIVLHPTALATPAAHSQDETPTSSPATRKGGAPPPPPPSRRRPQTDGPTVPAKTPLQDDTSSGQRIFNVPPPFEGKRISAPPPPGSAGRAVPAPPPRAPAAAGPPVPSRQGPPLPPANARPVPGRPVPTPMSQSSLPPPPPPMPPMAPPVPTTSRAGGGGPPPPPGPPLPPGSGAPPPPGPPPPSLAASLPSGSPGGRDDLLASIRGAGGLKKLKKTETVDKSGPAVPGAAKTAGVGMAAGGAAAAAPDMASQLAAALGQRNKKVAVNSDGEESEEDW